MSSPRPSSPRWHSLDSLRASMMSLGLVLHGANAFAAGTPRFWPYDDPMSSSAFNLLIVYIHAFRMPAFFLMAGFFSALLAERRGTQRLLSNRLARVLVPLLIFWPVVVPLFFMGGAFATARLSGGFGPACDAAWALLVSGEAYQPFSLHLWFLRDLLVFYFVAIAIRWMAQKVPDFVIVVHQVFRAAIGSRLRALWIAIPTGFTLYPMASGSFDTEPGLIPSVRVLVAYGLVFLWGWLLYNERDLLPRFKDFAWTQLLLGSALLVAWLLLPGYRTRIFSATLNSLATWMMVFGITGLFIRYLSEYSGIGRYLSDASYWIYLMHAPLLLWINGVVAPWEVPVFIKFGVVLGITIPILLVSYHFGVRNSFIGKLLNGHRYPEPRIWPQRSI
ncbi:MAG: acyltransferase family protein [Myxococcota bacterium]